MATAVVLLLGGAVMTGISGMEILLSAAPRLGFPG